MDFLVVLDSPAIAKGYDGKMKKRLLVRNSIYELSKKIAIDLLVFTRAEYEIIAKNETSFYNEITATGKVLYEKPI